VGFAKKYNLMRFIKLNSKVLSATWEEKKGICKAPEAGLFMRNRKHS